MQKKSFDTTWEQIHKEQSWGQYPSEDVIRFVARNYYKLPREKIKILDYGCGAGANTLYLAKEKFDTYAFDGSESAVSKAEHYLNSSGLTADFKVADAMQTEYADSFFDCVIDSAAICQNGTEVIQYLYNDIYRMLKIGGRVFSTGLFTTGTTGYNSGVCLNKNTYKDLSEGNLAGRGSFHFFCSESEIIDVLLASGFHDISVDITTRSEFNRKNIVEYYMVSAVK